MDLCIYRPKEFVEASSSQFCVLCFHSMQKKRLGLIFLKIRLVWYEAYYQTGIRKFHHKLLLVTQPLPGGTWWAHETTVHHVNCDRLCLISHNNNYTYCLYSRVQQQNNKYFVKLDKRCRRLWWGSKSSLLVNSVYTNNVYNAQVHVSRPLWYYKQSFILWPAFL